MKDQRETLQNQHPEYEENELRSAAERYSQPVPKEKSPEALKIFVIGEHLRVLREEAINRGSLEQ